MNKPPASPANENKEYRGLLDTLTKAVEENAIACDKKTLKSAFDFTWEKHFSQKRLSGESYVIHPAAVATLVANMGIDCTSIVAALLHDTVEDTATGLDDITALFGQDVARLVDGVTKISKIKTDSTSRHLPAENIRKMLIAMTQDVRVIFIKLADKLHNMRTLSHMRKEKQERISRETLDIYAPLANRLGIGWIKNELEDLALKYLDEEAYYTLKKNVEDTRVKRAAYVANAIKELKKELSMHGIGFSIKGRAKHFYSIYKKMHAKGRSFTEIMDLTALRIITGKIPECYQVLGIIHSMYSPLYDRFKDYIALPKSNMYSSLHTTVVGPEGKLLEIQIRTEKMDIIAEEGAASHLLYKSGPKEKKEAATRSSWFIKLKHWGKFLDDPQGFIEEVKEDLLQEEIYVLTPKGDVIKLALGSTPIDFAYRIHTDVGHRCIGAKVNGKIAPLKTILKSCDIVDIMTSKNANPKSSWLKFIKSSKAKSKIRGFLKEYVDTDHLQKEVNKGIRQQPPRKKGIIGLPEKGEVYLEGDTNLLFDFAKCCSPAPGDAILGYVSRGRGIIIHKKHCPNIPNLLKEGERIVYPSWKRIESKMHGTLSLLTRDDRYILAEVVSVISSNNVGVYSVQKIPQKDESMRIDLELEFSSKEEWDMLYKAIQQFPGVEKILKAHMKDG